MKKTTTGKATTKPPKATRAEGKAAFKRWGIRALIALVAGVSIGAVAGVMTVSKLEPGRGTGVDSLAVMLDSIAKGRIPEPTAQERATEVQRKADSVRSAEESAPPAELIVVPQLTDMEEGAARNALMDAGLQVGEVQFQPSSKPAGTVLSSMPLAGTQVPPETAVTLILSDGRTGTDTLSRPSSHSAP